MRLRLRLDHDRERLAARVAQSSRAVSEADVLAGCLRLANAHRKVAWARRMSVGATTYRGADGRSRFMRFGFPGLSDILGQMRDGRLFVCEVKRPGGQATPEQVAFLALVAAHGGVACLTDTIEGLARVLDRA